MTSPVSRWAMKMHNVRHRRALTLLELVVVMIILGLLSTLAAMSLSGTMDRFRLNRATETIEMFDARARRDANKGGVAVNATIQTRRHRLLIQSSSGDTLRSFQLPSRVEISDIRTRRRKIARGDFQIRYNRDGVSPTYALQLQRGKQTRWLVILGVSGQIVPLQNEGEIDEMLSW